MNNEKNEKRVNSLLNKIKKMNFKKFARGFAVVWMIVFIVVMTITNVGIDKNFNLLKWLGSAMILFGITVFGLFIGESIGVDFSKEKPDGLYQTKLNAYTVFRNLIDDIVIYFPLWYDWWVPQSLERKQIEFLEANNVKPIKAKLIVKYCDSDDFWKLKSETIKKEVNGETYYIKKLTPEEIEPVEEVLMGRVKLELSGCAYYLQAFAESNQKDVIEQGEAIKKARKYNKTSSRAIRLIGGAIVSLALGILTVNDFMRAGDGQAWMNLVTRIANLFTALFSGWLSGAADVKLEAKAIENKTTILKMFQTAYNKKLFEAYDENEDARRSYEAQEAERNKVVEDIVQRDEEIQQLENKSNQIEMKGE